MYFVWAPVNIDSDCPMTIKKKSPGAVLLNTELCQNKSRLTANSKMYLVRKEFNNRRYASTGSSQTKLGSSQISKENNFYFSLVKSFFDVESKNSYFEETIKYEAEQKIGFSIGYQKINFNELGFDTQFNYNTYEGNASSYKLVGAGTYGINDTAHVLGGLSLGALKGQSTSSDLGLGLLAGVGLRFDRFGGSLSYVQTNNSFSGIETNTNIKMSGLELALTALF